MKFPFEGRSGTADTGFDRSHRTADDFGDFLLGKSLDILEDDGDAVAGMKRVQGLPEVADQAGVVGVFGVCSGLPLVGDVVQGNRRPALGSFELGTGQISGNGVNPRGQRRDGPVFVRFEIDPNERFLGKIHGLLIISGKVVKIIHDPVLIEPDKPGKSLFVSGLDPGHQLLLVHPHLLQP